MYNKDIVEVLRAAKIIGEYCENFDADCAKCILFNCCAEIIPRYWNEYLPTLKEKGIRNEK